MKNTEAVFSNAISFYFLENFFENEKTRWREKNKKMKNEKNF